MIQYQRNVIGFQIEERYCAPACQGGTKLYDLLKYCIYLNRIFHHPESLPVTTSSRSMKFTEIHKLTTPTTRSIEEVLICSSKSAVLSMIRLQGCVGCKREDEERRLKRISRHPQQPWPLARRSERTELELRLTRRR